MEFALLTTFNALVIASSILGFGMAVGFFIRTRQGQTRLLALQKTNESLQDEIWSLRDEAVARSRAEAASDAKSRFLATVSHEIRTPLNGVLGLADLLQATALTREQASYVDAIKSSGEALTSIIHEILDFSRIEAGHLDFNPQPMNLTALVEGVAELLAPRAQDKGLEIAVWVSNHLPNRLILDPARVRQVLLNLAGNAVKFTQAGGVGIRVELFEQDFLRFSVVDTGPGIAQNQRALIFNEFEMGDSTETRRHGGSGLGLAISRRIVEGMGGTLNLESAEGEGAHFYFNLPLQVAQDEKAEIVPRVVLQRRILIVANSPFEAPFIATRLNEAGADVVETRPAEAAALLNETRFDVLIVDCALGEAETSRISIVARAAGVRRILVLFSPFERHAFGQKVAVAFDGWLVKPVRTESLMRRIWPEGTVLQSSTLIAQNIATPAVVTVAAPPRFEVSVLLAEDDEVSLLVARKMLEHLGARVTCVDNGQAAVTAWEHAHAERRPFDVCLFDIRMPRVSGLQAARIIRQQEQSDGLAGRTNLMALSANAFEDDKTAALDAGFDAFLVKPIDLARLAEALSLRQHATVS